MKRIYSYLLFAGILVFVASCTCNRTKTESHPPVKISVKRLETDLFSMKLDSIAQELPRIRAKYGEFFTIFNYKVIQLGSSKDPSYPSHLKQFITDYYMNLDYKRVMEDYPDVNELSKALGKAFGNYKYYFPKMKIPSVFTCISGWNQSVVTSDTILGICLDKYLGRNCDLYKRLQLDKYMIYTMEPAYIMPDCMRSWGYTQFEMKDSAASLLSNMLYEGKIIYFMKKMLPDMNDTLIFGYAPSQLKWCINNLKQMWTYLVENKLMFSEDNLLIHKLIFPAPYTTLFTKESPGRACVFLGYQIVDSYMKTNPNVSLPDLMKESDYNKVLRKSGFKP